MTHATYLRQMADEIADQTGETDIARRVRLASYALDGAKLADSDREDAKTEMLDILSYAELNREILACEAALEALGAKTLEERGIA